MADDAHGFGHAHTIYGSLRCWRLTRVWERVMETLRQWERQSYGRLPVPSACGAESQSLKTATPAEDIGCDGHKTSTGRQRHIWVDTRGLRVAVVVTAANMDDRLGWVTLLQRYGAFGVTHRRQIGVDRGDEAQWRCGWGRLSRMPKATAGTSRMVKWTRKNCVLPSTHVTASASLWLLWHTYWSFCER